MAGQKRYIQIKLRFQIPVGFLAENVSNIPVEGEADSSAQIERGQLMAAHIHGLSNKNNFLAASHRSVQVHSRTHHFGNFNLCGNAVLIQSDMLRTNVT